MTFMTVVIKRHSVNYVTFNATLVFFEMLYFVQFELYIKMSLILDIVMMVSRQPLSKPTQYDSFM